MGNALGLELARVPEDECDFRMRERWGFWPKRLPTADSESLPTVLVAAMPPYVQRGRDRSWRALRFPRRWFAAFLPHPVLWSASPPAQSRARLRPDAVTGS